MSRDIGHRQAAGHIRSLLLVATGLALLGLVMSSTSGDSRLQPADVAVAPFTVERDSAGTLRAVADTCLEHLVGGLKAKGVAVVRHAKLSEKTLAAARPALVAVLGQFSRKDGQYAGELRLLEVASGEELRAYFINDTDPAAIGKSGEAAAARIAGVVKELKGGTAD